MTGVLPDWLADPALAPVWDRLRPRLEQRGGEASGSARLAGLDRPARHALASVLGRPVVQDTVVVDLGGLDRLLRARAGLGLGEVVAAATGVPLRDRVAERAAAAARRDAPRELLRALAEASPVLGRREWVGQWIEDSRTVAVLARVPEWRVVVEQAVAVLEAVLGTPDPAGRRRSRVDLAAAHAADAHALDEGRPLAVVVLRALACSHGREEPPGDARGRRELWESVGVSADLVSSTCLTLGLRPVAEGSAAARLRAAADDGEPVHLTPRGLRSTDVRVRAGTPVLVCENPRVLEAFADAHGGAVAVVCVSGSPTLVTLDALAALAGGGARLRYHGDFDWPGVDIANRLAAAVGAQPWLMSADDYLEGLPRGGGLPLSGRSVEAGWDPELAPAMREAGLAVHQESVLDRLLTAWPASAPSGAAGPP